MQKEQAMVRDGRKVSRSQQGECHVGLCYIKLKSPLSILGSLAVMMAGVGELPRPLPFCLRH